MKKLAQWLDLGFFVREPAHTVVGLAATLAIMGSVWAHVADTHRDPIAGTQGNRLILSSLSNAELMDRPTRLSDLALIEERSGTTATLVRAVGDEAHRLQQERRCLATGLYFEARGESYEGQMAVADVIMNRVASVDYPNSVCGVVFQGSYRQSGCQFSFTCDGASDRPRDRRAWRVAERLASIVTMRNARERLVAENVLFYHADYVEPYWASSMVRVVKIGRHIFYSRTAASS
ncbi:MAG: cell wall hydrolase [Parvibaculum sp.]